MHKATSFPVSNAHRCIVLARAQTCMTSFSVLKEEGHARVGQLKSKGRELETPALLMYTRRGSPLYLTPDMLQHLGPEAKYFALDSTKL